MFLDLIFDEKNDKHKERPKKVSLDHQKSISCIFPNAAYIKYQIFIVSN